MTPERSSHWKTWLPLLAVVTIALIASPAAAADKWWDFYKRGTAAAQVNDWPQVVDQMERAIAEKPNEEFAARARNEIIQYVPHFWLGIAKLHTGDIDGALVEWQMSEAMGVIQRTQYWPELRKWRSHAEQQKARKASEQSSRSRKAADAALQKAMQGQTAAIRAGASRVASFQAGKLKLKEAWDEFNAAGNDEKAYQQAAATASAANEMFRAAGDEATKRKAAGKRATTASRSSEPPVVATSTRTPDPVKIETVVPVESQTVVDARVDVQAMRRRLSGTKTPTPALKSFVREAQDTAEDWDRELRSGVGEAEAREIRAEVAALGRALAAKIAEEAVPAPVTPGTTTSVVATPLPKARLQTAYVAFANGSINESESLLESYIAEHAREAEAYLLRGCVRYTRAMLSRNPAKVLPEAEADFRKALELNRRIGLDARQFSPKLVAFFNDVRKNRAGVK